jgi:hypothetical protein
MFEYGTGVTKGGTKSAPVPVNNLKFAHKNRRRQKKLFPTVYQIAVGNS